MKSVFKFSISKLLIFFFSFQSSMGFSSNSSNLGEPLVAAGRLEAVVATIFHPTGAHYVLLSQVNKLLNKTGCSLSPQMGFSLCNIDEVYKVINQLIDQKLILSYAFSQGVSTDLRQHVNEYLERSGKTFDQLKQDLNAKDEDNNEFIEAFSEGIIAQRTIHEELAKHNQGQLNPPPPSSQNHVAYYTLLSLGVDLPTTSTGAHEEQYKHRKDIWEKLLENIIADPNKFDKIVNSFAQKHPFLTLGKVTQPESNLPQAIRNALNNSNTKQIIGPVTLGSGYFIFKVLAKELKPVASEAYTTPQNSQNRTAEFINNFINKLRHQTKIVVKKIVLE